VTWSERALRAVAERLLARAGVRLDGGAPWDIQVNDPRFFARALSQGSLGFGESYMGASGTASASTSSRCGSCGAGWTTWCRTCRDGR